MWPYHDIPASWLPAPDFFFCSEIQLQSQLDLTRSPLENRRRTGAGNPGDAGEANARVRVVELRRVAGVERLGAELQAAIAFLADRETFEQREVELPRARSVQDVAAGIAVRELCGGRKGARVEPPVDGSL